MRFDLPFRWRSLKAKLISNYLVVLGIGGLVTSIVGSYIVSSTIMMQARRSVDHDLTTARTIYEQQLETLKLTVRFLAAGSVAPASLEAVRKDYGFDFLKLTGDPSLGVVRAALAGQNAARRWFTDSRNNWAPNKPATIRRKGSDKPLIDTGVLRAAIVGITREE